MRVHHLAVLLSATLLAGCNPDTYGPDPQTPDPPENPAPPTEPGDNTPPNEAAVTVSDNVFSPGTATIKTGGTVTWTWTAGYFEHSVTFSDGIGSSPPKSEGTHQRTFATAGTYNYMCSVHGAAMSGSVVVVAP